MSNRDIIRRLYEEHINQDRDAKDVIAPDYVGPQGERGPDGFRAAVASLKAGVPDIHFTVQTLVAEGDRVAVRWVWSGTHTGTLRGFAASGKQLTNSGIAIYTLRDGRIVSSVLETDRLGILQQIGVVPA